MSKHECGQATTILNSIAKHWLAYGLLFIAVPTITLVAMPDLVQAGGFGRLYRGRDGGMCFAAAAGPWLTGILFVYFFCTFGIVAVARRHNGGSARVFILLIPLECAAILGASLLWQDYTQRLGFLDVEFSIWRALIIEAPKVEFPAYWLYLWTTSGTLGAVAGVLLGSRLCQRGAPENCSAA